MADLPDVDAGGEGAKQSDLGCGHVKLSLWRDEVVWGMVDWQVKRDCEVKCRAGD